MQPEKITIGERYFWFIDAEDAPLTVLSMRELDVSPALLPVREREQRVNGDFSKALGAVVALKSVGEGGIMAIKTN